MSVSADFYLRYYVGHKGKFGHEFLEFEFRPDGKLRYANNSNYKNDTMIRKEAYVHKAVLEELRRVIEDSEIMQEDDNLWPSPDRVGRQELEIVIGKAYYEKNCNICHTYHSLIIMLALNNNNYNRQWTISFC